MSCHVKWSHKTHSWLEIHITTYTSNGAVGCFSLDPRPPSPERCGEDGGGLSQWWPLRAPSQDTPTVRSWPPLRNPVPTSGWTDEPDTQQPPISRVVISSTQCDYYNLKLQEYVCITTYHPDTKSNPNSNPTTARNSKHSTKYSHHVLCINSYETCCSIACTACFRL